MTIEGAAFPAGFALILLSGLAFVELLIHLGNRDPGLEWGQAFLRASMIWAAFTVAAIELLSLLGAVTVVGLGALWVVAALAMAQVLRRSRRQGRRLRLPVLELPRSWPSRALLAAIVGICLITGFLAWRVPPQTSDSLNYHMSRVAHWAQNQSVAHYPTDIEVQNSRSPGAEYLSLQYYVVLQGDRAVNFVQWYAMLGSLIGVYFLAGLVGASRRGQLAAAGFAASLPMGIVQASNTMTDYVAAFWLVCLAAELFYREERSPAFAFIGLAGGLAVLTKLTAVPYLIPLGLLLLVRLRRQRRLRASLAGIGLAAALALVLNVGPLLRNQQTYGSWTNPAQTAVHSNQLRTVPGTLSNLLRNAALHAATPWSEVNSRLFRLISGVHFKLGVDPNDPRTTAHGYFNIGPPSTQENIAGNPAHALVILAIGALSLVTLRKRPHSALLLGAAAVFGFAFSSYLFKWQVFGSRYHLLFFLLAAPALGGLLNTARLSRVAVWGGLALAVLSWPWLVRIDIRPLLPRPDDFISTSVVALPREQLYFATLGNSHENYRQIAGTILDRGCDQVGLRLSGAGMEYPFWVLLGAPSRTLELSWIVSDTPSARYADPSFEPCAVICETCPPDEQVSRGLPLEMERGGFRLYLEAP